MKKFTTIQAILFALLTLVIGFFIGLYIEYPNADTTDLAGTIGKVDRYRNVQVTEEDIQLRNELVEDTAKRGQYERYLTFYYYYAVRTSSDLEQVLGKTSPTSTNQDPALMTQEMRHYQTALKKMEAYLSTARGDILVAIDMVSSLDTSSNVPVISYLNAAQDAIARIRSFDGAILGYIDAINTYLAANPLLATPELKDAHDILVLNMTTAAAVAQDKPTLRYLDKKKLMNNQEGVRELIAAEQFRATLLGAIASDIQNASGIVILLDKDQLAGNLSGDFPIIVDQIVAGLFAFMNVSGAGNQEVMRVIIPDQQQLGGLFCLTIR
jgi:hypothetical protein